MSDRKVRKVINEARVRAQRTTPRPRLLTWCLRQALHHLYGWRPYY